MPTAPKGKNFGPWFRVYASILDNPKLNRLSDSVFRGLMKLWALAKINDGIIPDKVPDIAFRLRMPEAKVQALIGKLISVELMERTELGFAPHDWNERQFESDVSTERVRKFRERSTKRDETFHETPPDSDPDTEADTEGSEAKASGAIAPEPPKALEEKPPEPPRPPSEPMDDKTWLFREGLAWLSEKAERPAASLRSLVGRWRSAAANDDALLRALIEEAQRDEVIDPAGWITKILPIRVKESQAKATPAEMSDDDRWRVRMRSFKGQNVWVSAWGPEPGKPMCRVPVWVLKEFGYEDEAPPGLLRTLHAPTGAPH